MVQGGRSVASDATREGRCHGTDSGAARDRGPAGAGRSLRPRHHAVGRPGHPAHRDGWLRATLGAALGLPLGPRTAGRPRRRAAARLDDTLEPEAYRLSAAAGRGVEIRGGGPAGVFWGAPDPAPAPRPRRLPARPR
ncbi:glycoside hydrolase family 20 zincin-like fold domain-containing protein, partial [Streptomyces canarius]